MANVVLMPKVMQDKEVFGFFDDFEWYVTAHRWINLLADSTPTIASGDSRRGIVVLYTDTTDNNEVAIKSNEIFLGLAGKPMFCEGLIQYAEGGSAAANVAFGFSNVIGTADFLLDNGAGVATSFSGAVIYKVDGGSVWKVTSSNGSTQTTNTTAVTAGGSTGGPANDGYHKMRIEIADYTSTHAQVTYHIDDVQLKDATSNLPIIHTLAYASLTEMEVGAYIKTGRTGAETLNVDYIGAFQCR